MMKVVFFGFVVLLLGCSSGGTAAAADDHGASNAIHPDVEPVVKWVRSKGGFFSPVLQIRSRDESDDNDRIGSNNRIGIYASQSISKGQPLMIIPKSTFLTSGSNEYDGSTTSNTDKNNNVCDTTRMLLKEYDSSSDYWPYTSYLLQSSTSVHNLPSSWSDASKNLFQTIVAGKELSPWRDITTAKMTYHKMCVALKKKKQQRLQHQEDTTFDSHLLEQAYQIVISRSWLDKLIPIYDMINHRSGQVDYLNGTWSNIETNSAHRGRDVMVLASRNIMEGEELKYAFHECMDCNDEKNRNHNKSYSVLHMLRNTGILQEYPRRWSIRYDRDHVITFDLEKKNDSEKNAIIDDDIHNHPQYKITSFSNEIAALHPLDLLGFLRSHLKRLHDMHDIVYERASKEIVVSRERRLLLDLYEGLTTALEYAELYTFNMFHLGGNVTKPSTEPRYDTLATQQQRRPRTNIEVCANGKNGDSYGFHTFPITHTTHSQHQKIKFISHKGFEDTCLLLNDKLLSDGLHTCISYSTHYHENLVHLPARYTKQVKRVFFLGGGDGVMMKEFLKYSELELVVGLELDQQVVRSSFRHFGAQPHFNKHDKIQWWFGDATKSLLMLPQEWYGTFDLVIIDLVNDVWKKLPVTKTMNFIEASMLLLNEHGVIGINEDEILKPTMGVSEFADYTVAIYDADVPVICEQSVYMASNRVDFLTEKPTDHKIDTLILPPVLNEEDNVHTPFYNWYEYISNTTRTNKICIEPGDEEKTIEVNLEGHGILMVLEAENVKIPLKPFYKLQSTISQILRDVGLNEISAALTTWKTHNDRDGDELIFVLQEGYVVIRTWPKYKYCAIDIQLWGAATNLHETVKDTLLGVVGSSTTSSSYRILTGGMHGTKVVLDEEKYGRTGPRITEPCNNNNVLVKQDDDNNDEAEIDEGENYDKDDDDDYDQGQQLSASLIFGEVVATSSLIHNMSALILVLCGDESTTPCTTIEAINNNNANLVEDAITIIPMVACSTDDDEPSEAIMMECEDQVHERIKEVVKTKKTGQIGSIFIDPNTPKFMGQILHKLIGTSPFRREFILEKVLVVSAVQDTDAWQRELSARFRLEFDKFDPAYQAEVHFEEKVSNKKNAMDLVVFSSGDDNFFSHLTAFKDSLEKRGSNIVGQIKSIENGVMNYMPEFEASFVGKHHTYDQRPSLSQWMSQQPLSRQTIFQFDAKVTEVIRVDDRVWVYRKSEWQKGKVAKLKADGTYSVTLDNDKMPEKRVVAQPNRIRKMIKDPKTETQTVGPSEFKVALHDALKVMDQFGFANAETVLHTDIGDGSLIVSFWSYGSVIVAWDGKGHVDVNLFTAYDDNKLMTKNFETFFLSRVPFLKKTLRDEQPRGYGGVVNFQEELRARNSGSIPFWAEGIGVMTK